MRLLYFVALLLISVPAGFGQTAAAVAPDNPGLPKDPREVIAAARPFYDFSDASLKPWHLKASYQLYDDKGDPGEQGTFEYWWSSPDVNRSSWTRPSSTHTSWRAGTGKYASKSTGEPLKYFEYKLRGDALFGGLSRQPRQYIPAAQGRCLGQQLTQV